MVCGMWCVCGRGVACGVCEVYMVVCGYVVCVWCCMWCGVWYVVCVWCVACVCMGGIWWCV